MDLGIKGKRALVLASSQGLGLGIATKLCEEGANVLICGRVEEKLAGVAADLNEKCSGTADFVVVDLSDTDAAGRLYAAAKEKLGSVDILVNKAGWGRVLTVASSGVVQPIFNLAMSNTIRSSLVGWSKSLSNEVAGAGITVNMLLPGRIATARLQQLDQANADKLGKPAEEVSAAAQATIPAGRYGTVEEFGNVGAFLCSEPASYMTGGLVRCDGGAIKGV